MTVQLHYGNWLIGGDGNVANNCCCGPEEDTTACSLEAPCAGGDPSMVLTVFDSDYAGGDIVWCGKTWTPAEIVAGESKCVCPTQYIKQFSGTAIGYIHQWLFGGGAGMNLARYIRQSSTAYIITQENQIRLNANLPSYQKDQRKIYLSGLFTFSTFQLGVLTTGSPIPTKNDYSIKDNFFGTYTAGGVEYAWARGVGWP